MARARLLRAAVALLFAVFASTAAAQQPAALIVDTDAGKDDLMAIAFLLASPSVRIEAVSVSIGLAHGAAGAANILKLLQLAKRGDVPVYVGRLTPLSGNRQFPEDWRRRSDELPGVTLPRAARSIESRPAAEFLAERLADSSRPVDVLALGGLTNLAEAFAKNPTAARTIRRLVIMGGAVRAPGNLAGMTTPVNTTAEWNLYIDPEAARRVFASGAAIRLVTLDATQRVPLDIAFARTMQNAAASTPLAGAVAQIIATAREWIESGTYFAWDPLAAAVLVDPSLVTFERLRIGIRQSAPEEGRTVVETGAAPNADVATNASAAKFMALFVRTLARH